MKAQLNTQFEPPFEPMQVKLNMLKAIPSLYDDCLARLELDGLSHLSPKDEREKRRLHCVLDFFCDKLCLEKLFIL